MSEPLSVIDISHEYAGNVTLIGVSLELRPGEITALLGPSGAGKSTLLRLLAGLETPTDGRILYGETILAQKGHSVPTEKRSIGLVFQDFALFPHLTAVQNIAFGLIKETKTERARLALNWLERMGLGRHANAYPHQMSGGEKQRLAIARALAPKPKAILMDEPFSNLDPEQRDHIRRASLDIIRALNIPALIVTHDAEEAMSSADRLAIMRNGKILQSGTPEHLYKHPNSYEAAIALGPIIELEATRNEAGAPWQTQFGPVELDADKTRQAARIGVRPEAFILEASSPYRAHLITKTLKGPLIEAEIEVEIENAARRLKILLPASTRLQTGQEIGLRLSPDLCVLWPDKEASQKTVD